MKELNKNPMRHFIKTSHMASAVLLVLTGLTSAADWPQWRGPDRSGLGPKSPALSNSLAGLTPLWLSEHIPSGDNGGRGSLVVYHGKVYGFTSGATKSPATDEVFCLDADSGKTLWKSSLKDSRGREASSTPCIANGKLYIMGSGNKAFCINADDGAPIWESQLDRSRKESVSSSFAVVGKVAIVQADMLFGLDADTGKPLWTQPLIKGEQASPVTWSSKGRDYVFCNSPRETHCVDAADGRVLWSVPGGGQSTPVVAQEYGGDYLVNLSESRKPGLFAYRLTDKEPQLLWTQPEYDRGGSPVVFDGHVYAAAGGGGHGHSAHLVSVHLDTGKVAWKEVVDFAEVSSPIIADGKLFVVCGTYLSLLQATPEKYSLLSKDDYRITLCTSPALVGGRLYLRQGNAVACYDLRSAP